MNKNKRFYIYRWIRKDTNEVFYIGKGTKYRFKDTTTSRNKYFLNIYSKYPTEVEILINNLDEKMALFIESVYIKGYKLQNQCKANFANGGLSNSGWHHTEEYKIRRGKEMSGVNNPFYGKKHNKNTLKILSEKNKGKKGPFQGKIHTQESILKNRNAHLGVSRTLESCIKQGNSIKGIKHHSSKQVIDLSTGFVWDSAKEASEVYSINYKTLMNMLSEYRKNKTNLKYI
jgi:hypothetical protein